MEKDPAFGDDFFDRENISSSLIKRVAAFRDGYHQNVGLVGKKFIGKSSLLQNFILTTHYSDIIPIYLEIQNESFSYFTRRFMGMMLVGYFQSSGKSLSDDIDQLIKVARRELPQTAKKMLKILGLLKKGKVSETFNELLSLTVDLSNETGKKIVLVLDEFTRMGDFDLKDPFTVFGKHIMVQKNTMYIVSSSEARKAYEIFSEKLSLLFGNFEVLEVKPFSFKTSMNFVKSRLLPYSLPKNLTHFLVRLTNGHPYYLSVFTRAFRNIAWQNSIEEISEEIFVQVLEENLFLQDGRLSRHFNSQLGYFLRYKRFIFLDVLVAIALGNKKNKQIAQFTGRNFEEVKKALTKLISEEIIKRDGHFYYIDDVARLGITIENLEILLQWVVSSPLLPGLQHC